MISTNIHYTYLEEYDNFIIHFNIYYLRRTASVENCRKSFKRSYDHWLMKITSNNCQQHKDDILHKIYRGIVLSIFKKWLKKNLF